MTWTLSALVWADRQFVPSIRDSTSTDPEHIFGYDQDILAFD
jgi:hypothetical protein